MKARKASDHRIAVRDYNGHTEILEADELRVCVPTKECVKFWVTCASCVIAIGIGVFFMVYQGASGVYFAIGEAMLSLGIGVLIPGPKYEKVLPKAGSRSRPATPSRDSGRDSTTPDADRASHRHEHEVSIESPEGV